ncbi:MAG: GNAT family N-acetyltransferase, partial [Armatimonadota bacterium]|nr:GNAT family N-acetyltransferase [Armatimonadota bacterium]
TRLMMFLYELGVAAEHRRQGAGQALVEELKRLCRERGFLKMLVLTKADNLPARELYVATEGEASLDDVLFWYGFTEEK